MILVEQGMSFFEASDAVSAMATLSREADRLDVVFSDLIMPGEQDGLDLARAIRRQWPQLPVILATGFNEAATRVTEDKVSAPRKALRGTGDPARGAGCAARFPRPSKSPRQACRGP